VDPREERAQIERLLSEWDPIGVIPRQIADGLPPSEYDSYAPEVHASLRSGCTAESLALCLGLIRTREIELSPDPNADLVAARNMLAWWESRDH